MFMAPSGLSGRHPSSVWAGLVRGMRALVGHRLANRHCHGKRREIKPETASPFGQTLRPGEGIELVQPLRHRLAQVIAVAAERRVALLDKIALLLGQRQSRSMAVGFRARDRPQKYVVDVAVEPGKAGIGANRLFHRTFRGGAIETRPPRL